MCCNKKRLRITAIEFQFSSRSAVGVRSVDLSSFRALGAEDLQAPWQWRITNPKVWPAYPDPRPKRPMDKSALGVIVQSCKSVFYGLPVDRCSFHGRRSSL
ncbi:hypothetical protein TNCV_3941331 [Trichonephila clavipes]|uniref:Uncharacterized protein n=1 Tax=Trichonephila clavipes TaxID=2585209 RepID=A0A8X6VW10_TRICX|nr:hypothetical protein TNCV_3941331 [Trichonephila clavipes]